MNLQETKEQLIADLIRLAFSEDIGDGDHTTLCCIPDTENQQSHKRIGGKREERLGRHY